MYSLLPSSTSIYLSNSDDNITIFDEKIVYEIRPKFVGNVYINLTRRQKWSITLNLRYNCRSFNSPVKMLCKLI